MIEYLEGIVLERRGSRLTLNVAGVGYGVVATARAAAAAGDVGANARVWTRIYVREDVLRLYGFAGPGERDAFDLLTGINGVGPAVALALLSELSVGDILQASAAGDARRLTKVKGVGTKMAEKIMLELKTKSAALAALLTPEEQREAAAPPLSGGAAEAAAALEALDVPPAQARKAVAKAIEALGAGATTEALIREGLRRRREA